MASVDPHELRDSLVADLVAESVKNTGERNGSAAEALVRPVLERMERKEQDGKQPPRQKSADKLQEAAAREGIAGKVERFERSAVLTPRQADDKWTGLLRKRVRWLNSKPEYRTKIQSVFAALWLKRITPQQAERRLWELVNKSDEHTKSPWWKDERPVIVGG